MLVSDFLENSAKKLPDKIALITDSGRYTYKEIDETADKVAGALISDGFKKGDCATIFMDNEFDPVVSLFAILKAGGIFMLINPTTKTEKLTYILNNSRATALLSSASKQAVVTGVCNSTVSLKNVYLSGDDILGIKGSCQKVRSLDDVINGGTVGRPVSKTAESDLAMLIYTSGSTGNPKGVMMTHLNMVSAAKSVTRYLENSAEDIIINTLPLSFDYGLYQVLMAFMVGATVILEKTFAYPYKIIDRIIKEKVTGFPIVPTIAAILFQKEEIKKKNFEHLRYISNTAAALSESHIRKLREFFPKTKIFSMYGLTECKRVSYLSPDQIDTRPTSVGKGMPDTEVHIADTNGNPLGPNETGELVVRGPSVMQGYWELPEETAKVLRPGPIPGEKFLYTGDLFKMDEEGYLYFIARKDDIIKSRGEKVGPREVENIIHAIDGVVEVVVNGIDDPLLGQAIKARIVQSSGSSLTERGVKKFCLNHLEDFMVPKYVEFVAELPKTETGKILAKASILSLIAENGANREGVAIVDTSCNQVRKYKELAGDVKRLSKQLSYSRKALVFCFCNIDLPSAVGYLASLNEGHAVCLLDALASDELKMQVVERYQPDFILETVKLGSEEEGLFAQTVFEKYGQPGLFKSDGAPHLAVWKVKDYREYKIYDSLSVLLSTSGTTGSPKLVRLSMENVYDNANSIREYLEIDSDEKAITSLPFHYSYGLSVLNSHLLAGACIVMTGKTIIYPEFWKAFNDNECTSFSGVPHSYRILDRSGFAKRSTPTLRTMTQAGGKMENHLISKYDEYMKERNARLVVMYGQTEATARISYLPSEMLREKLGSIGIPIPGGKLAIFDGEKEITEPNKVGEIVYYGRNVMLGYATSPEDLAKGDLMNGKLRTGDLGCFDEDGYFFIKGRIKRFVKIYGLRINLDELEEKLKLHGPTAVTGNDEKIFVFCNYGNEADYENYRKELAKVYKLNINTFVFKHIDSLPAQSSGKIDYKKLNEMAGIDSVGTSN